MAVLLGDTWLPLECRTGEGSGNAQAGGGGSRFGSRQMAWEKKRGEARIAALAFELGWATTVIEALNPLAEDIFVSLHRMGARLEASTATPATGRANLSVPEKGKMEGQRNGEGGPHGEDRPCKVSRGEPLPSFLAILRTCEGGGRGWRAAPTFAGRSLVIRLRAFERKRLTAREKAPSSNLVQTFRGGCRVKEN